MSLYNHFDQTSQIMLSGKSPSSLISPFYYEKLNSSIKGKSPSFFGSEKSKKIEISKAQLKTHLIKKFKKTNPQKIAKQRKFLKVFKTSSQSISDQKNFTCPICLQILISPIIFQCGHFGCMKCIETVSVYQNKCFLCRRIFQSLQYKPSNVISAIINKNILKNIENPIEHYTRLADHIDWQIKKQISIKEVQIGSMVDIKCSESGKWKTGIVLSIKNSEFSKYTLLIKYKHQGQNIEELLDMKSMRLAKHGFYTQKRAIEISNAQREEPEIDIPQISIDHFQNITMDRTVFFLERKQETYFSDRFEHDEEFNMQSKIITPLSTGAFENWDVYERDLQQFLNPQFDNRFMDSGMLELNF